MTAKFGKTFNKKKYCPRLEPKRILTLINLAMLGLGISYLQHADVAQASEIGKVNTYKNANSLKTNQLLELTKNGKTTKEVGVDVKTETHSQASKSNDTNKRADSNQASRLLKKNQNRIVDPKTIKDDWSLKNTKVKNRALITPKKIHENQGTIKNINFINSEIKVKPNDKTDLQDNVYLNKDNFKDYFNQNGSAKGNYNPITGEQKLTTGSWQSGNITFKGGIDLRHNFRIDGSTMTIAELQSGLATKVSNSEYASYKDQTASQIGQLVTNGAFSAYQQTTAELISAKVATSDFSAYQATTAKAISSKVESNDFNSYKEQTAKEFSSTIEAVQTQVTDSAVGTNLVKDSEQEFTGKAYDFHDYNLASITELTPGETYTMSFSARVDDKAVNCQQQVFIDISNPSWGYEKRNYVPISTDYQRVTYTFTIPEGQTGVANISAYLSYPVINGNSDPSSGKSDVAGTGYVKEFKLEKGSHATDYSVNPEDIATQSQFTQLSNDINLRVTKDGLIDQINLQAGNTLISSSGQLTLSGKSVLLDSVDPVIMKSANIDSLLVGKKLTAADIPANTFSTNNGTFTVDQNGAVVASNLTIRGVTNLVYNAALLGNNGSYIPGWVISNNGVCWANNLHDGVPSIGFNSNTGAGVWNLFAQTKLHSLNGATGQPFSASVWFKEYGSDTSLQYQFTLAFFDSNGNRINGSSIGNTWNGISSSQDWRYVAINNAVAPSNAVSVGLQYWAANGHGNACFSSPMLTQTAQSTGYQPDTGNVVSAGEIDGSVINGSTINGTTINTPNLNLGDNGQIIGDYSVNDDTGWFQPINGTGSLKISHGYIQSTANIIYYNKILNGIGGDKWGHWASSTQFVPAPDQAHPDASNIAESTLTPAFLKLDIFNADKSAVSSRVYIDGTGLYINNGGTQAISAMLSDYELVSSGMAYLNSGIQMKQEASFTFGNLAMNGHHTIAMLDSSPLYFSNKLSGNGSPIEIVTKTFTKASRLSIKHDITPLSTAESSRLLNAIDVEKFWYTHDGTTYKYQYGGVIDDVNSLGSKQYSMPPELLGEDGTGINLDSLTGVLVKRVQDQDKTIGELSMRLTRLEIEK